MAIAQDGSGFIWLATQSGLTRWDGYHFRHYTADPQTPGSLPDSFPSELCTWMIGAGSGWVPVPVGLRAMTRITTPLR